MEHDNSLEDDSGISSGVEAAIRSHSPVLNLDAADLHNDVDHNYYNPGIESEPELEETSEVWLEVRITASDRKNDLT